MKKVLGYQIVDNAAWMYEGKIETIAVLPALASLPRKDDLLRVWPTGVEFGREGLSSDGPAPDQYLVLAVEHHIDEMSGDTVIRIWVEDCHQHADRADVEHDKPGLSDQIVQDARVYAILRDIVRRKDDQNRVGNSVLMGIRVFGQEMDYRIPEVVAADFAEIESSSDNGRFQLKPTRRALEHLNDLDRRYPKWRHKFDNPSEFTGRFGNPFNTLP